jgi:hypothetical protein
MVRDGSTGAVRPPPSGRLGVCTDALLESGVTAIAYETVQLPNGSLPLLAPMSEVAGRMAAQVGAPRMRARPLLSVANQTQATKPIEKVH